MNLTNQVMATKEAFVDFIKNYPSGTPLVMLNILKFKAKSGQGDETGERAYNRYGKNVHPLMTKVGGKVLWAGKTTKTIIGDLEDQPDRILLVQYPSKEAFIEFTTSDEYKVVGKDREIALEYGALLATETLPFG